MKEQRETDIVRDCLTWLRLHDVFCWRQNQGAITGQYHGKRRFLRFTSVDGVSDILGVLRPQGLLLALEVNAQAADRRRSRRRSWPPCAITVASGHACRASRSWNSCSRPGARRCREPASPSDRHTVIEVRWTEGIIS